MSASLHWKPVPRPVEDDYLSHALMFKLRKRLWNQGESLSTEVVLSMRDVPYLQGLADCDVEDAQKLIDLIKEHGEVIVYHKF